MPKVGHLTKVEAELRELFVKVAREVYERGLVKSTEGNISARIPGTNFILIKPTGMRLKDLTSSNLIKLDLFGRKIEGEGKPSREYRFHTGIYRLRNDVGAIIHVHSPFATTLAMDGKEIPIVTRQAEEMLRKVPVVDYAPPGSIRLAELVIAVFKDPSIYVALLKNHGCIAVGKNLIEAFNRVISLEETAKAALLNSGVIEIARS